MRIKGLPMVFAAVLAVFLIMEAAGYYIGSRAQVADRGLPQTKGLRAENRALRAKLEGLAPKGIHIVIDTADNTLFLKNGAKTLKAVVISSGSGSILKDTAGKRQWVFDTPRGEYAVKSKIKNPNWIKPDWAFIEEGESIPSELKDRVEEGVLGEYALGFGSGYFIHGTLYRRLLGRSVTHGCIRVGDQDLKAVYNASPIGTRIFIF
ncbi:MAG: L,D-transpeptidase [Thermodesulfovibrionales bacterium]|nr:L,D-transpeptidase [Thermodesulfovibrionales bacterium]